MNSPNEEIQPVLDVEALKKDLAEVLNRHNYENLSNTPDFILAAYLVGCLKTWNGASTWREEWYGFTNAPGQDTPIDCRHRELETNL